MDDLIERFLMNPLFGLGMFQDPEDIKHEFDKATVLSSFQQSLSEFQSMIGRDQHFRIHTSFREPSLPSVPLQGLAPITLAQMELGKTHRGRVLFGTLCSDAFIMTAVSTCLEDETGKVVKLGIYNAAPSGSSSFADVQKLFPKGIKVAVKEPYLKRALDGRLLVRIDNPANFEKLCTSDASTHYEVTDRLRTEGNRRFGERDWRRAIQCYTESIAAAAQALSSSTDECRKKKDKSSKRSGADRHYQGIVLAYSNRAEAWLKLHMYDKALADCDGALGIDAEHVKSLYRKGRALRGLKQYHEACALLQRVLVNHPQSKEAQSELAAIKICLKHGGELPTDISEFLMQPLGSPAQNIMPDCYDYIGPVIIQMTSDGRGRGLFVSKNVKAGEVLLVSNAMAVCRHDPAGMQQTLGLHLVDASAKRFNDASEEDLVTEVVSLAMDSQEFLRKLYSLAYSPSQNNMAVPSCTGMMESTSDQLTTEDLQQIDMGRIREIVRRNAFGDNTDSSGLWWLPSFINHSCLPNACALDVGEAMFVHASADIQAGEEITMSYSNPLLPLMLREKACRSWGFQCDCKRCIFERSLQHSLQGITLEFISLHEKAKHRLMPAASLQSRAIYDRLRKILRSLNVTSVEKQWLLAAYSGSFGASWVFTDCAEETITPDSAAMELLEAIKATVPGHISTLCVASRLVQTARRSPVQKSFLNRLIQEATAACICVYGKQKDHVLRKLIMERLVPEFMFMP